MYLPQGPGPHPSAVLVHGGGFLGGWRSMPAIRATARDLVAAGIAVAAFDYRLLLRGGNFAVSLEDTLAAFDWWVEQAPSHGADPDQVSLIGLSAGAALAAAASEAASVQRLVLVYGPHDFTQLPVLSPLVARALLGTSDPREHARRSPLNRCVTPAPTLLLHGTEDRLVPIAHSVDLQTRRDTLGLPTELVRYQGHGHGFLNWPDQEVSQRALRDIVGFVVSG